MLVIVLMVLIIFVICIFLQNKEKTDVKTTYEIDNQIQSISGNKAVLKNVRTECEGHFGNIDTLIIHEQGIYLIYYTKTNGTKIDNNDKNKWVVSTRNGLEYIPNYITQSDYDIIFLTKILNLYKHNFRVIITLGDKEYFAKQINQVKSIRLAKKYTLINILKKMIDENIILYNDDKINRMKQQVQKSSEQVQQKIYNMGNLCMAKPIDNSENI